MWLAGRQFALWSFSYSDKLQTRFYVLNHERSIVFFKSKPAISDHEKARVEFHLQEIAESIGFDRLHLPVVRRHDLMNLHGKTAEEIVAFAGQHLSHDTAGLQVQVAIEVQEKCGGGG